MIPGPITLHLDVVNACNTDCITCWDHSPLLTAPRASTWKEARADVGSLLALVADADSASPGRLNSVIVSGMGEPLIHPGIYDLLTGLKARKVHVTLITNLLAADSERLLATGTDSLLVGLHAANAAGYQAFHPSAPADAWDRVCDVMERRFAAGFRDKQVQVICAVNAAALPEMIRIGARYRAARVNFKLASLGRGTEQVQINAEQRAQLLADWIPAAERRATELGVTHNLAIFRNQLSVGGSATAPIHEVGCHMGGIYARVAVDGTVYFCCNTETVIGRVGNGTRFSDLWRGPEWEAMRARLSRREFFPGCSRCGKYEQNARLAGRKQPKSLTA
jgi:MoaA/NifB/PqqE/SkfB family radical SAM enzyme